ncbi:MAG TPA: tetratricopeptide repeat protein [Chthoniobacterales bacterium]|nr:tetratricopeptide repeat protein [Chthoniobacterales bacterium]
MKIDNFFAELKRRNVYKVAVAYLVISWLLIQAASILLPTFEAPAWVMKAFVVILALGFVFAVFISWAFEMTPEGMKRTADVSPTEFIPQWSKRKFAAMMIGVAVIAAGLLMFQLLRPKLALTPASSLTSVANTVAAKSIAVLPLVNTSGDPSNEYFSDGLSEELIAVLAKISDLKVIGRSSSFLFKGQSVDSTAIGQKLGVAHLIEGSVRKQGDRVRIIAELINAADGRELWSETYDRELKDVFAVQTEIASAVAEQMKVKLLGEKTRSDAAPPNENLAAYNAVLQSDFYFQQLTAESVQRAIHSLQEAVRLDPNYALAHAKLSLAWRQYAASFASNDNEQAYAEAKAAAEKAIKLAPDQVEPHKAAGWVAINPDLDFAKAEQEFRRALQISPSDAGAKSGLSYCLMAQGHLTEAERAFYETLSLDPLSVPIWFNLGRLAISAERYQEAEEAFRKALQIQPGVARAHAFLATLDVLRTDPAAATKEAQQEPDGFWRDYAIALAKQVQPDKAAAEGSVKSFCEKYANGGAFQAAILYAVRNEPDQMFKWLDTSFATRDAGLAQITVTPFFRRYFSDPRFVALFHKLRIQPLASKQ